MPNNRIEEGTLSIWNGKYPDKKSKRAEMSAFQKKVEDLLILSDPKDLIAKNAYEAVVGQDYIDCTAQRQLFIALFRRTPIFRSIIHSEEFLPRYVTVGKTRIELGETFDVLGTYNTIVSTFQDKVYATLILTYDQCFPEEILPQEEDGVGRSTRMEDSDDGDDFRWDGLNGTMRRQNKGRTLLPDRNYTQEYTLLAVFEEGLVLRLTYQSCMMHMDLEGSIAGKVIKCLKYKDIDHIRTVEYIVHTKTAYSQIKLPIRKQKIDINVQYNDDLPDNEIQKALLGERSGIVLLHGDPGTGKTSYIRHLAYTLPRKFIFLDKSMFHFMTDASFIDLLSKKKGSIIVLEDCEDLLVDRSQYNESMSTVLNLSDGILGDGFSIKFICTFNCPLDKIDSAITRKGRLKVKYEFKPLCKEKAQKLLDELKADKKADGPMTLADIYGHDVETGYKQEPEKPKMGF